LDAARGNADAAFPIWKAKLADPFPRLIQELRWLRGRYADDTDDILKEELGRFADKCRSRRGEEANPSL
jgi:hypothetical protein